MSASASKTWREVDDALLRPESHEQVLEKIFLRSVQRKQLVQVMNDRGVTWLDVLRDQDESLKEIISWLKLDEKQLSELTEVLIQQDQKIRKIYTLNLADKWMLTTLATNLSAIFSHKWSSNLYSFQKGKNIWHAHQAFSHFKKKHKGKKICIVQLDVSQYGESIEHGKVLDKLDQFLGHEDSLSRELLKQHMRSQYLGVDKSSACFFKGIPSGSPLVPFIENLYLMDLDFQIETQCGFYARFGDDILLADLSKEKVESCFAQIDQYIKSLGLLLKPAKVKWTFFGEGEGAWFEWLGHRITDLKTYGPKLHQTKRFHAAYKKNLRIMLAQLLRVPMNQAERLGVLNSLFQKSTDYRSMPEVLTICLGQRDPTWLKQEDQRVREIFVSMIHRHLGISKKEIWNSLSQSKHRSLNRQRRHLLKVIPWN